MSDSAPRLDDLEPAPTLEAVVVDVTVSTRTCGGLARPFGCKGVDAETDPRTRSKGTVVSWWGIGTSKEGLEETEDNALPLLLSKDG